MGLEYWARHRSLRVLSENPVKAPRVSDVRFAWGYENFSRLSLLIHHVTWSTRVYFHFFLPFFGWAEILPASVKENIYMSANIHHLKEEIFQNSIDVCQDFRCIFISFHSGPVLISIPSMRTASHRYICIYLDPMLSVVPTWKKYAPFAGFPLGCSCRSRYPTAAEALSCSGVF